MKEALLIVFSIELVPGKPGLSSTSSGKARCPTLFAYFAKGWVIGIVDASGNEHHFSIATTRTQQTTVESQPSKDEGWGTRLCFRKRQFANPLSGGGKN